MSDKIVLTEGAPMAAFQRYIQGLPDGQLRRTARSLPNAVLDANFLKEVANTRRGFRIALARGYSESNRPEDAVRAMKLAGTLLDGRLRVPEESRWYWEAQVILIRAELNHSQGLLAGGKDASAQAKELLDAASRRITNLHGADPRFGEDEVEGNEAAMKELIEQLNVLRQSARMGIFRLAAN